LRIALLEFHRNTIFQKSFRIPICLRKPTPIRDGLGEGEGGKRSGDPVIQGKAGAGREIRAVNPGVESCKSIFFGVERGWVGSEKSPFHNCGKRLGIQAGASDQRAINLLL
jgi:hypothetical protein